MKQRDAFKILKQGSNILLTGAAGSGKTYLLEKFASWARGNGKNVVITATTGIAATNINGKTIHNYANLGVHGREQLMDGQYVKSLANTMRKSYKDAIIGTHILIIDEISMLQDYQLDAVDKIMKVVRNNPAPFGGVQVVLSGDFFQLPPVTGGNEQANFITESESYTNEEFKGCYLEEYWRQDKNDPLVKILNAIRSNTLTNDQYVKLEQKVQNPISENITKLFCANKNVDDENQQRLNALHTESQTYQWEEIGEQYELEKLKNDVRNKVVENLELRTGSIVMFVKNNQRLGYYNGSIGEVISFDNNLPNIKLKNGCLLKSIKKDDFYRQDASGQRLATIKQIPLKLAWAITIHKSQGMTIDKVAIDLTNTFTAGQGYVALSRVRSIDDISLVGITRNALQVSPAALEIDNILQEKSEETRRHLKSEKPDISK